MLIWIMLGGWIVMIVYFGTGKWGRGQTQSLIDRLKGSPRIHAFLDRHHGKLRASFHYLEFGGLTLILYGVLSFLAGDSLGTWSAGRAALSGILAAAGALLDELHQLSSGNRCFRLVDYLHSCCGICLALLLIRYGSLW